MIRQGDVLLIPANEIPADATKQKSEKGRLILARGEATGHHHSVAARNAVLFLVGVELYLRVIKNAMLEHQEHGAIQIPAGDYRSIRQREYTPENIRTVQD
jgi:hypothetical protein